MGDSSCYDYSVNLAFYDCGKFAYSLGDLVCHSLINQESLLVAFFYSAFNFQCAVGVKVRLYSSKSAQFLHHCSLVELTRIAHLDKSSARHSSGPFGRKRPFIVADYINHFSFFMHAYGNSSAQMRYYEVEALIRSA